MRWRPSRGTTHGVNENGYSTRHLVPFLQPSQNGLTRPNVVRVCLSRSSAISPPNEKETHASKHDVALGRLPFKQRPIVEGSKDSLDADRCEQGDFGGIANESGDHRVGRSTVLEKTLEDSAADVA